MNNNESFKALYEARHEPENLRPLAELYWRILLLCALAAAGAVIGFGAWEFSSVISTMSSAAAQGTAQQAPAIDKAQLENALVKFSERRANFEMSKSVTPAVSDPSK
jgi:hypothetical protein